MPTDDEQRLQRALAAGCTYINRRERTAAEVRLHLERGETSAEVVDAALRTLMQQRLVDDARFAEMFVTDKRELQQWGDERILRGLRARGVDRTVAEAAVRVDDDAGRPSQLERALEVLRQRFPEPPRDRRQRHRALGLLLRKGYDSELAVDALAVHARGD